MLDPHTLWLGDKSELWVSSLGGWVKEESVLGPSGPEDSLFRGQIESELMFFFNLFIDHKKCEILMKNAPAGFYFSVVIMISFDAFFNFKTRSDCN